MVLDLQNQEFLLAYFHRKHQNLQMIQGQLYKLL